MHASTPVVLLKCCSNSSCLQAKGYMVIKGEKVGREKGETGVGREKMLFLQRTCQKL